MSKDDLLRIRCSAADKERLKKAASSAGESLSEFVLQAAKLRASQQEHGSATRSAKPKIPVKEVHVPPVQSEGVVLSDGMNLSKRSFSPDPKK